MPKAYFMYKQTKLLNNAKLITIPMAGTKTVTVLIMVKTGSKYENENNNGISHFLEHMFFKGTIKRPNALTISSELDSIGSEYNAFTGKEYTGYWVKTSADKIDLAIDIVSDMLLNSKFKFNEIEKEKGVIIEEMNMYYDNPLLYIEDVFEELLYGNTPAGWNVIGTKKNILKFTKKDLLNYFNSQYSAEQITICLAGNIQPNADKIVNNFFHTLKAGAFKNKQPVMEKQTKPNIKIHYKETDQATISLGVRTVPVNHKNEFILKILSIILGGSMSSRLFIELREKKSLAYYVKTQAEFFNDSGYLTTQAGIPIDKIQSAVKIILKEYQKLTKNLVNKKELQKIKDLIRGRMAIQLEASENTADWYCRQAILRNKILTPEKFLDCVDKITSKDIQRVAQSIFINKKLNLAIIGPVKNKMVAQF